MTDTTACARGCRIAGAHIDGRHPKGPVADACPGCLPRPSRPGLTVCVDCVNRAASALAGIVDLWDDLRTGITSPIVHEPGASIHTSDLTTVGDMYRPKVARIVADIRDWIEYVARFAEPAGPVRRLHLTTLRPSVALAAMRRQLVPLLAVDPGLDASLVDDVLRFRRKAAEALSSGWMRRIPLTATCPTLIEADANTVEDGDTALEVPCGAELVGLIVPADFGSDATVQCLREPFPHTFPSNDWGALSEQVEALQR